MNNSTTRLTGTIFIICFCLKISFSQNFELADSLKKYNSKKKEALTGTMYKPLPETILVSVKNQKLYLALNDSIIKSYPISTSRFGTGNKEGSNQTPLGMHVIKAAIGNNAPPGRIFEARRATQKIAPIISEPIDDTMDYVTSRILWLDGLELGKNKGGNVDSYNRHIYIHGTHEEGLIGTPASHGCVRMKNKDVIELFSLVRPGTLVVIVK